LSRKRFVFNAELWNSGLQFNCKFENNELCRTGENKAVYISPPLDSGEKETEWGRMEIDFYTERDGFILVSYFAYENENITIDNLTLNLEDYLNDFSVDIKDKINLIEKLCTEKRKNIDDLILSDSKGRYFRFMLEMEGFKDNRIAVKNIKIQYPLDSIIQYLPSFFSENKENAEFLKRFLGIYQALIYDLQDNIDNMSKYFDCDNMSGDFLDWLCGLVGINSTYMWTEDKLKKFVKKSFYYYKLKGTKQGLKEVIGFYTNEEPIIIETNEIMDIYSSSIYKEYYEKLYGSDIYSFYIFIKKSSVDFKDIEKLVEIYKPAHTKAYIIILNKYIVLGEHSYIGINSGIMGEDIPKFNKEIELPFNSILID